MTYGLDEPGFESWLEKHIFVSSPKRSDQVGPDQRPVLRFTHLQKTQGLTRDCVLRGGVVMSWMLQDVLGVGC